MDVQPTTPREGQILVTGSTGYVGGRLVPKLLERGLRLRVLVRDPKRLQHKSWLDQVEVVRGDVLKPDTLGPAMAAIESAYYLIHSMVGEPGFRKRERQAATNFGQAARHAGLARIIYLGGLGDPSADLSEHLRSRQMTGELLRASGVPVTELRSPVIIGSGSASFEMIRYLVEGLPLLLCPPWVTGRVQPIGIRDVLAYLLAALEEPSDGNLVLEIGGSEVLPYRAVLQRYASLRGLHRMVLPLPWMPPGLCARMVGWLTPIPTSLARPLIEGLRNDALVREEQARRQFPEIEPMGVDAALLRALTYLQAGKVETTWRDAFPPSVVRAPGFPGTTRQGMIMQRFEQVIEASQEETYRTLLQLGQPQGWGLGNPLWQLYRLLARWREGEEMRDRRGREDLRVDDIVGGWRVVELDPSQSMHLEAERQFGGSSWTNFEVERLSADRSRLSLVAYFAPHGFWGVVYWYLLAPIRTAFLLRLCWQLAGKTSGGQQVRPDSG